MKVILSSGSPRRKELLGKLGVDFTVVVSTAEEIHEPSLGIGGLCEENARLKASAVAPNYPDCAVIGADTLVFIDAEPFIKQPGNQSDSILRLSIEKPCYNSYPPYSHLLIYKLTKS